MGNMATKQKKKESFWELLRRLDEEAGQFNSTLHEANHYFDKAVGKTKNLFEKHEKELHDTIGQLRKAIRDITSKMKNNKQ
jgi:DNA relaxase NicK